MGINQYVKIGSKIKKARISKGIRQKDMAGKLGLSISTYSNYENNYREPKLDVVERICDVLDMTIDELIDFPISDSERFRNDSSAQNDIIEQRTNGIAHRYDATITPEKLERIKLDEEAEGIIKKRASGQKITDEERQKVSDYIERTRESLDKICEQMGNIGKIIGKSFVKSVQASTESFQALMEMMADRLDNHEELNPDKLAAPDEPSQDEPPTE